ncbi:hypothetical protein [Haloferula sp.]|uniref:hypothetical protein n=1 Tax=Haloferula sp. TaxID=2497595 RepID=UPI00329B8BCC
MKTFMRAGGLPSNGGSKRARPFRFRRSAGLTLVEMSVVIFALILLATLLLTTARAWLRGSDRAMCIVNIQAVQKGIRGYANMSGLEPGAIVSDLEAEVVGTGKFFVELPICPANGSYTLGGDQIPGMGTLYMNCSLGGALDHVPDDTLGW